MEIYPRYLGETTWSDAVKLCKLYKLRLPTRKELKKIFKERDDLVDIFHWSSDNIKTKAWARDKNKEKKIKKTEFCALLPVKDKL